MAVNDLMDPADRGAPAADTTPCTGRFRGEVEAGDDGLIVDGREVRVLSERDPADLPWEEMGVEVVVESTGLFTKRDGAAKHLEAGARKVIISAPATEPDITICIGVNDDRLRPRRAPRHLERLVHDELPGAAWSRCCSTRSASSAAS